MTSNKNEYIQESITRQELNELANKIRQDRVAVFPFFEEFFERRERNWGFYGLSQWDDAELEAHYIQNRIPYQINEIQRVIEHLVGTQTQTRLDVKLVPREKGDEAKAEQYSNIIKWCEQINKIEQVETQHFREMLIGGAAASVNRWEMTDVNYGYPVVENVPINELIWDLRAKKEDLSDARWMARVFVTSKLEAYEMFPFAEAEIVNATPSNGVNGLFGNQPFITNFQKQVMGASIIQSSDKSRQLVDIVEHYEKSKCCVYVVTDNISGDVKEFDEEEEACAYCDGLKEGYAKAGEVLLLPNGEDAVLMLKIYKDVVYQTILVGNTVIAHQKTGLTDFPYTITFCYWNGGNYWAFVDHLIPLNMIINRSFSQWDAILSAGAKHPLVVQQHALAKGWSIEQVRREWSNNHPVIPVVKADAIVQLPSPQVNPQIFDNINFSLSRMNDFAGGENALGLQENAAESGRAVIARAEQGGVGRLPLFDRLKTWRETVTLKMLWFAKNFMPTGQALSILGQDDEMKYLTMDEGVLNTFREMKMDVVVDESIKSNSMKQKVFQSLIELFSRMSAPPDVMNPLLVEYAPIPQRVKDEIMGASQIYQQIMQQEQERQKQLKIENEVKTFMQKKHLKEQLEMGEQLQDSQNELRKQYEGAKKELQKVENIQSQASSTNLNGQQSMQLQDTLRSPQDIGQGIAAFTQGALTR